MSKFFTFYTILQENPPFNKGAFKIQIDFPAEYPFKPPKILFKTKIYHPNVDEKGQVCLPIISAENWKPATKTDQGKLEFSEKTIRYLNDNLFRDNSIYMCIYILGVFTEKPYNKLLEHNVVYISIITLSQATSHEHNVVNISIITLSQATSHDFK